MLCLQTEPCVRSNHSALVRPEEMPSIELKARLRRRYPESSSRRWIVQLCRRSEAVSGSTQHEVVIEAAGQTQLLVAGFEPFPDPTRASEVERRAGN